MICKKCGREFKNIRSISVHIGRKHKTKDYYDKYLKKEGEGKCLECKKETAFIGLVIGYCKFCSTKCLMNNKEVIEKRNLNSLNKYGFKNPSQNKEIKEKIKNQWKNKTIFEKENIHKKRIKTNLKRWNKENVFQLKEKQEKQKQTLLNRYGVDNYAKTLEFRELAGKNMIQLIMNNYKDGSKFSPTKGKNEKSSFDILQSYCSYILLEDQQIGHLWPDRLIKELMLVIEFDELWHSINCHQKHDKIKDEFYKSKGFTSFRISEKEWFKNQQKVIENFIETIKFLEQVKSLK